MDTASCVSMDICTTLPTDGCVTTLPTDGCVITLPTDGCVTTLPTDGCVITLPTDGCVTTLPTDGCVKMMGIILMGVVVGVGPMTMYDAVGSVLPCSISLWVW